MEQSKKMTEDKVFKKARAKFKSSDMSNAKWRKLFIAVASASLNIWEAEWRFIDGDVVLKTSFPGLSDLNKAHFNDGRFQPFEYKWIKTIFVPHQYRVKEKVGLFKKQDTEKLVEELSKVGKFPLETSDAGVTIFGYSK